MSETIEQKTARLESLQAQQKKLEVGYDDAENVFDGDAVRSASNLATQIGELKTEIRLAENAQREQEAAYHAMLEKKYDEYVAANGKEWNELQKSRFRQRIVDEGNKLGTQMNDTILAQLMDESKEHFAKSDKALADTAVTIEGDDGLPVGDKKEKPKDSSFDTIVQAMAKGSSNVIPPTDPEKVTSFFTQLQKDNNEYRRVTGTPAAPLE